MNKRQMLKIVKALRSGYYIQIRDRLYEVDSLATTKHMCCLGVMTDLFKTEEWDKSWYKGHFTILSKEIVETLHVKSETCAPKHIKVVIKGNTYVSLAEANDSKEITFEDIATWLELNYLAL